MRIHKKRDGASWRIFVDGKPTDMWMNYDRVMREWSLGSTGDHLMSAHSMGAIMRRLDVLAANFAKAVL